MRGEITYPIPNGTIAEHWEWMSNFIQYFLIQVITYPDSALQLKHVSKMGSRWVNCKGAIYQLRKQSHAEVMKSKHNESKYFYSKQLKIDRLRSFKWI